MRLCEWLMCEWLHAMDGLQNSRWWLGKSFRITAGQLPQSKLTRMNYSTDDRPSNVLLIQNMQQKIRRAYIKSAQPILGANKDNACPCKCLTHKAGV